MNAVLQPQAEPHDAAVGAAPARSPARSPWRPLLAVLVPLLLLIVGLYRGTALGMVEIWARSDTFMHAFLVPPLSAWLIWRQRARVAAATPQPAPWLLLPAAGAGGLWLLGEMAASNAASQFALVSMLVLAVAALCGRQATRAMLFPLLFLFFAVPAGEFLMPWLMSATADFTVFALRLSGVPVYREGLLMMIPTGHWSVVEACSGVRYLIASLMVGTLFAYLNFRSMRRRLAFVGVAIAVPVVANWLRAYMIVMIGHLSGNRLAVGVDHLIYGWVFFGIVMLLMFMIGGRYADAPLQPPRPAPAVLPSGARVRGLGVTAVAYALLAALPPVALHAMDTAGAPSATLSAPTVSPPWAVRETAAVDYRPVYRRPSAELQRSYADGEREVGLYVAYYRQQDKQRKLVSSDNVLVASLDPSWHVLASGRHATTLAGQPLSFRTARLRGTALPGQEAALVVWQAYWVDGRWTDSDALAKLYGIAQRLQGRGDDGASVVLYAAEQQPGQAEAALEAYVRANGPAIEAALRRSHAAR